MPESHALSLKLGAWATRKAEQIAVGVRAVAHHRQESLGLVLDLESLVFNKSVQAFHAYFRLVHQSVLQKVPALEVLSRHYFMDASLFVPRRLPQVQGFPDAELSEILCQLGGNICEELNGDSAELGFVALDVEEDNGVVFCPEHSGHGDL